MKKSISALAAALAVCAAGVAQAGEFPVRGSDATGRAGDTVFVGIDYDYGAGLSVMVEDLVLEFSSHALKFREDLSTFDGLSLTDYIGSLRTFAGRHNGGVLVNSLNPGEYRVSYYTADSAGHDRSGGVQFRAYFDIAADAAPGVYTVSLGGDNVFYDVEESEFTYPEAMQNLRVTVLSVVPEPAMALLLMPGLALVGWQVKRSRSQVRI